MILKYKQFNEGIFNIDLKRIKEEAYKFSKTKECVMFMSEIDPGILNEAVKELKTLKEKYGSIDNLTKKLWHRAEEKNESIIGMTILTVVGIHAFIKLLAAIKDGWSLGHYIGRLFSNDWSGNGNDVEDVFKTTKDVIIMAAFLIYMIAFITQSVSKTTDIYHINSLDVYVDLPFKWSGVNNFKIYDAVGKEYLSKRDSAHCFSIYYKGKLIGYQKHGDFLNLKKQKVIEYFRVKDDVTYNCDTNFDLEKTLNKSNNAAIEINPEGQSKLQALNVDMKKDTTEINNYNKEISNIEKRIDSVKQAPLKESVDVAKKLLSSGYLHGENNGDTYWGRNTVGTETTYATELENPNSRLSRLKRELEENNNIGYLGLFTKFIYVDGKSLYYVLALYKNQILPNKNILNKLRDENGNLKSLIEFNTLEKLVDALVRLNQWSKINQFVRQLPPTQKNLIWENGWYKPEISNLSQYIDKSIIGILNNSEKMEIFMRKISSIKDTRTFITLLRAASNSEPWDFDYWLYKLNDLKNVVVTWESKEKKQIICAIFSWNAIRQIAYMTSWCIYRESDYFRQYESKGYQLMLFDFSKSESNYSAVIGFTVTNDYRITDCHDKSDNPSNLPNEFVENKSGQGYVKKEYILMGMKKLLSKLDMGVFKILKTKIRHLLHTKYISSFIDWYV